MTSESDSIVVAVDGVERELTRGQAAALRDALGRAARETEEFVRTVGEHRPDGSYVVRRRAADSPGNEKVFDSFAALEACYDELPATFTADEVESAGVSGSRRHLLVRYFVEHPSFDCELTCRNPLTARKGRDDASTHGTVGSKAGSDDRPGRDGIGEVSPSPTR